MQGGLGRGVGDETLLAGEPEHAAVVEVRLLAGPGGGVLGRVPGVEVGVEVDDAEGRAVRLLEGAEGGEGEAVVAAEGDELGLVEDGGDGGSLAQLGEGDGHLL